MEVVAGVEVGREGGREEERKRDEEEEGDTEEEVDRDRDVEDEVVLEVVVVTGFISLEKKDKEAFEYLRVAESLVPEYAQTKQFKNIISDTQRSL